MLLEFKKAKLADLQLLENKYLEITSKSRNIKFNIEELEREKEIYNKEYTFIEKYITKRREYQNLLKINENISKLEKELITVAEEEQKSLLASNINIDAIRHERDDIAYSNKMNYSFEDIMSYLESKNITPVLTEEDKIIIPHERDYSSKDSLIGVHKSNYYPQDNKIRTTSDSNVYQNETIKIDGKEYKYSYKLERDTIHMSINDEVSSHSLGNWDDCKYSILIPFKDLPNEKIAGGSNVDMFTYGSIDLPKDAWILCPEEEVSLVKEKNPQVHVIGYNGKNVSGYSKPFLTQLGYRGEDVGMWDWNDQTSSKEFHNLMEKEHIRPIAHTYSEFAADENMLNEISRVVALSKCLNDNKLIYNEEDIAKVMPSLENNAFNIQGLCLLHTPDRNEAPIRANEITRNNRQIDIFLEKMQEAGLTISPAYQNILKKFKEININKVTAENINEIFADTNDLNLEEKNTIESFKEELLSDISRNQDKYNKFLTSVILNTIKNSPKKEISKREEVIEFLKEQKEKLQNMEEDKTKEINPELDTFETTSMKSR